MHNYMYIGERLGKGGDGELLSKLATLISLAGISYLQFAHLLTNCN